MSFVRITKIPPPPLSVSFVMLRYIYSPVKELSLGFVCSQTIEQEQFKNGTVQYRSKIIVLGEENV